MTTPPPPPPLAPQIQAATSLHDIGCECDSRRGAPNGSWLLCSSDVATQGLLGLMYADKLAKEAGYIL